MSCDTPWEQIKLFCPTLGKLKIAEKLAKSEEKVERRPGERRSEISSALLSPFSTLLLYCRGAAIAAATKTRNGYRNFAQSRGHDDLMNGSKW
jgi:hypothetical protein